LKETTKKQSIDINQTLHSLIDMISTNPEKIPPIPVKEFKNDFNSTKILEKFNVIINRIFESEYKYKTLMDTIQDAIIIHTPDGNIIDANREALRMFDQSIDKIKNFTIERFISTSYKEKSLSTFIQNTVEEKTPSFEWIGKSHNRHEFPVKIQMKTIQTGDKTCILSLIKETIKHKTEQNEGNKDETLFYSLFNNNKNGFIIIRGNEKIQYINQAAIDLFKYTKEELLNINIENLFLNPSDKDKLTRTIKKQNLLKKFLTKLKDKNNNIIHVEISASTRRDNTGKIIECYGIISDITEIERTEQEILRLSSLVKNAEESIIFTDLNGIIQYVNPAFEKTTGYKKDEVIGNTPNIVKSGEHKKPFYEKLWGNISSGKFWHGTLKNKKKDGDLFYEDTFIFPIFNKSGIIINYASIKKDVTHKKYLEKQLRQSQKLESIGHLAGGISHEFKNILTVMIGTAELALLKLKPTDLLWKELIDIKQSGERAAKIANQLLAFSRKQSFFPEILDINDLFSNLYKMLINFIGEDIHLELELQDNISLIKADRGQIEQIIMNLIVNAKDALYEKTNNKGNKKITIKTSDIYIDSNFSKIHPDIKKGKYIIIIVSDTGIGMDEQTKKKIFDPFFTTKDADRGTGLGLSTVNSIVKQNNGSIHIESHYNKGTIFKIYLRATNKKQTEMMDKPSPETKKINPPHGTETILVVEDELSLRKYIYNALKELGYHVLLAENGKDALELINDYEDTIDLLFTDITMPLMNGEELYEFIKKEIPGIKVLFTSGYSNNIIQSQSLNDMNFICKPYNIIALAIKIREIINS